MREVYILGAGASKASANTPLGSQLVWEYHESCMLFSPVIGGEIDNTEENIRFQNQIKFLKLVGQVFPELKNEEAKFKNRQQFMYSPPSYKNKKYYVDEILRILQEKGSKEDIILIKKLTAEHIIGASIMEKNGLYRIFKTRKLKSKQAENVSIISFNFDFLLHEDFNDEFCFDYIIEFSHPDLSYRKIICEELEKTDFIPLIKLNGSLDWGICPDCQTLVQYPPAIDRFHYNHQNCYECSGLVEPFIIIPHEKYNRLIEPLWDKAANIMKSSEKVTIIGYSFPEYDQRVMNFFRNNINKNSSVEVVDFCNTNNTNLFIASIKKRYRKIFPGLTNEILVNPAGFEEYLSSKG